MMASGKLVWVATLVVMTACTSSGSDLKKGSIDSNNAASQCDAIRAMAEAASDFGQQVGPSTISLYWRTRSKLLAKCIAAPAKARECFKGKKTIADAKPCALALLSGTLLDESATKTPTKRRSRRPEARRFIKRIYDGARSYYMDRGSSRGMQQLPPQFPGPSQGPTPPLGTCCKNGGKCTPSQALWTSPTWTALQFSMDDPHYYSYSYKVTGNSFTVTANGDLDCDGEYSTFQMTGVIDAKNPDGPSNNASVYREKELE